MNKKSNFNKVIEALIKLPSVEHKKPKYPSKEDLKKKFKMRLVKGKLIMDEVK